MKIGVAKFDAGVPARKYTPVDPKDRSILKGHKWQLHDGYDFDHPSAIFEPEKKKGEK